MSFYSFNSTSLIFTEAQLHLVFKRVKNALTVTENKSHLNSSLAGVGAIEAEAYCFLS